MVLTYFYTNVMGLNIAKVAFIMLISRFFDGASDIVAGAIIDRTRSKYGKARPWLLRMALPHLISLIAMFTVPRTSENMQLIYIFIAYNFANTIVNTMVGLALSSMNSLMTRDPGERGQLNAFRQFGSPIMELAISAITIPLANYLGGDQKAWIIVVSAFSVVATACYLLCFLWSRETTAEERGEATTDVPVLDSFVSVLMNKYWFIVLVVWIMCTFYLTISGTNLSYYCQYLMGNVDYMSVITTAEKLSTIILTALAIPFLLPRLGKRNMMLLGACIVAVGHTLTFVAPTDLTIATIAAVLRGASIAPCFAVLFAMIADCVEYGHWKTMLRVEGAIFCAATVGQKFGQGVASAIVGNLLDSVGYDGTLAVQSAAAEGMISWIYLLTPVLCFGVIVILMLLYRLDREMPMIMKDLEDRKKTIIRQ